MWFLGFTAADQLDISGDVILDGAPTALAINSVGGGTGGETTTGIEVVTVVNGTSDAGAFVLAGPVEVGALSYDLSLGQCDDTANDNWYLCNNGTIGTTGAVFEAMPGVVLNSFARTETLQQRLGARVQGGTGPTLSTQGDADLPVAQSVGPWMRTWGDFADITPDNSSAGTSLEADSWGLEAGIGTILGDHAGGNLVGGVNLRYGATYADLSNPVGTASLNAEGFGMAASLTWFGNDGFYVDGNAAVDFVSIDATSQGGGELLNDHDDVVYSASAEVGKRIELQGGTTLVPQAQLSWGKMRDGSLTDNLGNVVSFADRETLTSRVGLTVEQDVTGSSWGAGKVFGFGKVLHDLEGSRTATVAGTDVTQSGTGDWLELGGGFSLQPTENSNVFGQVSYREAFNGVDGDAIAVSAGWRMQW
jgi:fibronectin-binding autotransporter adhesin